MQGTAIQHLFACNALLNGKKYFSALRCYFLLQSLQCVFSSNAAVCVCVLSAQSKMCILANTARHSPSVFINKVTGPTIGAWQKLY